MADLRPIKFKPRREFDTSPKPTKALLELQGRQLNGLLSHGCVYVVTGRSTAWWLDRACLGRQQFGVPAVGVADDWIAAMAAQLEAQRQQQQGGGGPEEEPPVDGDDADMDAALPAGDADIDVDAAECHDVDAETPATHEVMELAAVPVAPGDDAEEAGPPKKRQRPPPISLVRLSMLEAVFLMHGLENLTLYEHEVPNAPDVAASAPGVDTLEQLSRWASPHLASQLAAWRSGSGSTPECLRPVLGDAASVAGHQDSVRPQQANGRVHANQHPSSASPVPPGYRHLSDADVWHAAVDACPGFLPAYAAYYHCRCMGWLIRSGLQYGADYVLYPRHPNVAHSSLCALVVPPSEGPGSSSQAAAAVRAGWPQWTELQALSRLCVQVNKGLVLLHVVPAVDDNETLVEPRPAVVAAPAHKVAWHTPAVRTVEEPATLADWLPPDDGHTGRVQSQGDAVKLRHGGARGGVKNQRTPPASLSARVAAAEAECAASHGVKVATGAGAVCRAPTVRAHLSRVRVVEVEVSRWNPGKGRMTDILMPADV